LLTSEIKHPGIVKKITDSGLEVQISPQTACSGCHSKSHCSIAELEEKIIQVTGSSDMFSRGEHVSVVMKESLGMKAVFFAYVLPVIILIFLLIPGVIFQLRDLYLGLVLLTGIIVYYVILYLLRHQLQKKFTFTVKKQAT